MVRLGLIPKMVRVKKETDEAEAIGTKPEFVEPRPDTINSMPPVSQTLRGFRIAVLYRHCHETRLAESVGASFLHVYRYAPDTSQDEFETYWDTEVKRARADGLTLIVLKNRIGSATPWCSMLEQIEEKEWYGGEKRERLRFVMREDLLDAIAGDSDGGLLYDSWGDVIEEFHAHNSLP
mmetsp:Transcript_20304/g.48819  ORF Transcript_20304/g.48819 Transcript_20304/m.48819 type:complete len:179 (+) Transcript_20304:124-660(+)